MDDERHLRLDEVKTRTDLDRLSPRDQLRLATTPANQLDLQMLRLDFQDALADLTRNFGEALKRVAG